VIASALDLPCLTPRYLGGQRKSLAIRVFALEQADPSRISWAGWLLWSLSSECAGLGLYVVVIVHLAIWVESYSRRSGLDALLAEIFRPGRTAMNVFAAIFARLRAWVA
jgi:hypothetical protein